MKLLLVVMALGLAGASPLVDNKVCQPHSRPWQAFVRFGGSTCGGALIDESWIATSFECTWSTSPEGGVAYLGEYDLSVDDGTEQTIPVADVVTHDPYRSPLHSLALIRLARPARFNQYVQPIPLATRCPRPDEICEVSGWGSTVPNRYQWDQRLKCISVPIVDDRTCENTFPEFLYWSYGMVCAGRADTDNCLSGDSVMVCDGQLQGVQWFAHGCRNPAHPSVYTKMCLYNSWIRETMESYVPTATTPTATWGTA